MRLDKLWISEFKNLRDFTINFDEESPYAVLVGGNGTGKSNLIEALVLIFRNLDLNETVPFAYRLEYRRAAPAGNGNQTKIIVSSGKNHSANFVVDGKELSKSEFYSTSGDGSYHYLPKFVFGYYSGPSDRLAAYFRRHQERFYTKLKNPKAAENQLPLRPLFLAQNIHGQFVLLAFYSHPDSKAREFLRQHLGILDLDSVRFSINKPAWATPRTTDRFWGTTGIPRSMLDRLDTLSIATTQTKRKIQLDFRRAKNVDCWNFMLDRDAFQEMANAYKSPQDLFKALESTHISDLLLELVVDVKVEDVDGSISFRELSEGEQQLLLVLGLLRFTKEDEALFLLDEPDTHLNPAWSVQYLNFIEQMVGSQQTSQIVMATHDPLVFGGLTKSQVNVLTWGSDRTQVIASKPVEDPRGMGIEAILTSDLFGLRAALDIPTLEDLDRRRRLVVKGDARNPQEQEDLKGLNEKLAGLDYSLDKTDPLFSLFMESMTKWEEEQGLTKTVLTKAEQEAQRDKALQIIRALKAKKPNTDSQSK